jgi:hypothetical protein
MWFFHDTPDTNVPFIVFGVRFSVVCWGFQFAGVGFLHFFASAFCFFLPMAVVCLFWVMAMGKVGNETTRFLTFFLSFRVSVFAHRF